jgi:peptidoglycan/xylan/chitin deacetylase (PgdA/CDA1 family)
VAGVIYLTFDDGPVPETTERVLEELAQRGVPATFFQEGRRVQERPDLALRARESGHLIGNHAWSHPDLRTVSDAELERQLRDTSSVIEQAVGVAPRVFRPPYGGLGDGESKARIVNQALALGMHTVVWTVDTYDYTDPGVDVVVRNAVTNAHAEAVILMHDKLPVTAAAIGQVVDELTETGYTFDVLPTDRHHC